MGRDGMGVNQMGVDEVRIRYIRLELKGLSEILQDIRTSTYQTFTIEENTYCTTKFHK